MRARAAIAWALAAFAVSASAGGVGAGVVITGCSRTARGIKVRFATTNEPPYLVGVYPAYDFNWCGYFREVAAAKREAFIPGDWTGLPVLVGVCLPSRAARSGDLHVQLSAEALERYRAECAGAPEPSPLCEHGTGWARHPLGWTPLSGGWRPAPGEEVLWVEDGHVEDESNRVYLPALAKGVASDGAVKAATSYYGDVIATTNAPAWPWESDLGVVETPPAGCLPLRISYAGEGK